MSETVPARTLVIDDEPQIRRFLDISLRAQGYVVLAAATADDGLAQLATDGADVVILDLGLPDRDGVEVLRDLRQWSSVPVLVLTARGDEDEKVKLLDAGANDYVTKPFGIRELMARLRALRRMQATADDEPAVYDDGELRIDPVRREVLRGGVALSLTRKEYALLTLLVRHAGRVVTQPQLLREVWGPTHQGDTHYLRILVGKLRQKLGDDAAHPRWIATEPGVGLRFLVRN
ncbi:response regulator [Cognatilysobacter terrigena]|uniref:response regulator n=1 Tax=Cognatilysobacter terrigena TaxID=2488749 RepID=UPI00105DBF1B|nr:response regulator [Lysobacter terrigena]